MEIFSLGFWNGAAKAWDLWKFLVLGPEKVGDSGIAGSVAGRKVVRVAGQEFGTFGNFRLLGPGVAGKAGVAFWLDGAFGSWGGSLLARDGAIGDVMSFLGI